MSNEHLPPSKRGVYIEHVSFAGLSAVCLRWEQDYAKSCESMLFNFGTGITGLDLGPREKK